MNKQLGLAGMALIASSAVNAQSLSPGGAVSGSGAIFSPTDQNVNFFDICYGCDTSGVELAIFDDSVADLATATEWLAVDLTGDVVQFDPDIGQSVDYTLTNKAGGTMTLSGNDLFQIGLRRSASEGMEAMPWSSADSIVCSTKTDSCTASWHEAMTSLVVDVTHERDLVPGGGNGVIPVPPAVWLLGSGLVGLIGVARRKNRA